MKNLILYNLKKKKNFALINLSIVILFIVIFMIINKFYVEASVISVVASAIIALVGTFIDFNIFANENKLTYFASKPISMKKRVDVLIISNIIYMLLSVFIALIITRISAEIAVNMNSNLIEINYLRHFELVYRGVCFMLIWTSITIFLIALSSMYCGSTASQVVTTALNFILPIMLYFTFYSIITMDLQNINISYNQITQYYLEKLIPLYEIYFMDIFDNYSIMQVLRFIVTLSIIYTLLQIAIRKRKNERVGEFIVSYGYKNFIVLFAATFLASVSIFMFDNYNYIASIITFLLNLILIYYIIFTIVEKNFKIGMGKISLLIKYCIVSTIIIITSAFFIKMAYIALPESDEVSRVYVSSEWTAFDLSKNIEKAYDDGRVLVYDNEDIVKNFITMNMLSNNFISNEDKKSSVFSASFSIIYELKNGKRLVRNIYTYNEMNSIYKDSNNKQIIDKINAIIYNIMKTDEFKDQKREYVEELLTGELEFNIFDLSEKYRFTNKDVFSSIKKEAFMNAYFLDMEAAINSEIYPSSIDYDFFSRKFILGNQFRDERYFSPRSYMEGEDDIESTFIANIYVDTIYVDPDDREDVDVPVYEDGRFYGVKRDSFPLYSYNENMIKLFEIELAK